MTRPIFAIIVWRPGSVNGLTYSDRLRIERLHQEAVRALGWLKAGERAESEPDRREAYEQAEQRFGAALAEIPEVPGVGSLKAIPADQLRLTQ